VVELEPNPAAKTWRSPSLDGIPLEGMLSYEKWRRIDSGIVLPRATISHKLVTLQVPLPPFSNEPITVLTDSLRYDKMVLLDETPSHRMRHTNNFVVRDAMTESSLWTPYDWKGSCAPSKMKLRATCSMLYCWRGSSRRFTTVQAMMLPIGGAGAATGGHRGHCLYTLVEILCASLAAGVFTIDLLGVALDGSHRPHRLRHSVLTIGMKRFVPFELSKRITGQIMRDLQSARKAPGQDRTYVAGEKEHEMQEMVREQGIPVNWNLRRDLQTVRYELGIVGYEPCF
jgi:hypothetical protein